MSTWLKEMRKMNTYQFSCFRWPFERCHSFSKDFLSCFTAVYIFWNIILRSFLTENCCLWNGVPVYIRSSFQKKYCFPADAEYSYFSVDFTLKIALWVFLGYSEWHFCFRVYLVSILQTACGRKSLISST